MKRWWLAVVVVASLAPVWPAEAGAPASLPWLHVGRVSGSRPQIMDSSGRTVMLRGTNLRGIEDDFYPVPGGGEPGPAPQYSIDAADYAGRCPAMRPGAGEPPLCQGDLAAIRAEGFDFVRLPVSWSLVEPEPGRYSQAYLDRIAQVVGWAGAAGVYVLIDMHQDDYSRFIPGAPESPNHADGAPAWAVMTDGLPSTALAGQGELSLAVEAAFTNFWLNRDGLQDHYIAAMAALARRFRDDPTVAGYEIINEPLPGLIPPVAFSSAFLYPFYRRVTDELTSAVHTRQAIFFEPMAVRNLEDAPDQLAAPFTSYPNIVYAPHDYTHVFTVDREAGLAPGQSPYPVSYDQPYQVADTEARSFGAALICGEFGEFSGNPATFDEVVGGMTAAQDRYLVGSTYWAWTGGPVPAVLRRVYPSATAGVLRSFSYSPASGRLAMTATADRRVATGDRAAETVIRLPAGGRVSVSGAARLDRVSGGLAYVAPTGRGDYSVTVAP